jgi:hypothetical protein
MKKLEKKSKNKLSILKAISRKDIDMSPQPKMN